MKIRYRMKASCSNCPFNKSGPGLRLRRSLMPGRFAEILRGLKKGDHFICHKTAGNDEDYEEDCKHSSVAETIARGHLLCAGSIEWQSKRVIKSEYLQICERLFEL